VYSIPSTGLPWPIGVALTLIPVAIGILLVRRKATGGLDGPDALRVVTGIVSIPLRRYCLWRGREKLLHQPQGRP
jgi:hypothetical protein